MDRLISILWSFFFGILTLLLFILHPFRIDPAFMMILSLFFGISLIFSFFPILSIPLFSKIAKGLCALGFTLLTLLAISTHGLINLLEEKKLATVTLTGKKTKKWVEWKPAQGPLQSAWLDANEIVLETAEGRLLGTYWIYGDFVAVRIQLLRLHRLLNFFGISNALHIDAIHNGYASMERHNHYPHLGYPLPLPSTLFSSIWSYFFYKEARWIGIDGATLESEYLPLFAENKKARSSTFHLVMKDGSVLFKRAFELHAKDGSLAPPDPEPKDRKKQ